MSFLAELIDKKFRLTGYGRWLKAEEHDSLVVDTEKELFYWNSRGIYGNALSWLTDVEGMTFREAQDIVKKSATTPITYTHKVSKDVDVVTYPDLVDVFHSFSNKDNREYWYKRGITDTTIDRFKLGYFEDNGMYWNAIPIFQDGIFRNFQIRTDTPKKTIKSYYRGVGRLLFNSDIMKLTNEIIICEGPTDCLRLMQEGIPCISHNAGSEGWDDAWFKYFIHQKQIYVVYDADKAGNMGSKKVAKSLGEGRTKIYNFWGFEGGNFDIVDWFKEGYSSKELIENIKTKSKYLCEV